MLGNAFDDLRRSTALHRLAAQVGLGVLTDAELAGFTAEVRDSAVALSELLSQER